MAVLLASAAGVATAAHDRPAGPPETPGAAGPGGAEGKPAAALLRPGSPAPPLTVETWITGTPVAAFERGKVYIVYFWAVWAPQSATLVPRLSALQREFAGKGVSIVGVASPDKRNNTLERVEKFVADREGQIAYMVAWDKDRTTSTAYLDASEAPFIPWAFVIDKDGKIAFCGSPHEYDLGLVLDRLFAGTWDIAKGPGELDEINQRTDRMLRSVEPRTSTAPREAWEELKRFEADLPRVARGLIPTSLKAELMIRNQVEGAEAIAAGVVDALIAEDGRMIGGMNRRSSTYLNQIAWAIVDPALKPKSRNLDLALKAAEAASAQTSEKEPAILDTLARVCWLRGDKVRAVELQKKAIRLAGEDEAELKKELEETLKEYQGLN